MFLYVFDTFADAHMHPNPLNRGVTKLHPLRMLLKGSGRGDHSQHGWRSHIHILLSKISGQKLSPWPSTPKFSCCFFLFLFFLDYSIWRNEEWPKLLKFVKHFCRHYLHDVKTLLGLISWTSLISLSSPPLYRAHFVSENTAGAKFCNPGFRRPWPLIQRTREIRIKTCRWSETKIKVFQCKSAAKKHLRQSLGNP